MPSSLPALLARPPSAESAADGRAAETTILAWRVHRLRGEPQHLPLVIAAYAVALGLWRLLFPHPLALFVPLVSLTSALAEYLFPISYRLTDRGAHVSNGPFVRLFLAWPDVKRATAGKDGVCLSPLARPNSPLAPFRGLRLRFTDEAQADEVTQTVRALRQGKPPA
jgi:hypothetical protein